MYKYQIKKLEERGTSCIWKQPGSKALNLNSSYILLQDSPQGSAGTRRPVEITLKFCYRYIRRRQWHPTPVLLPGKSHGWRSLVGCSPWGRQELDTTERPHFTLVRTPSWAFSSVQLVFCLSLCFVPILTTVTL